MKEKSNNKMERFARYMRQTYKNKIIALLLLGVGLVSGCICGDAEPFVIMTIPSLMLFLAKKNYIY